VAGAVLVAQACMHAPIGAVILFITGTTTEIISTIGIFTADCYGIDIFTVSCYGTDGENISPPALK
jgi:hypothetical protein